MKYFLVLSSQEQDFTKEEEYFYRLILKVKRKVDRKDSFSRVNLANFGIEKNCIEVDPKFTLFYLTFFKSISKYLKFRASSNRESGLFDETSYDILTIEGNTISIDLYQTLFFFFLH